MSAAHALAPLCAHPNCAGCPLCASERIVEREYHDLAARVLGVTLPPARFVCGEVYGPRRGYVVRRRASGYLEVIAWRPDASTLVSRRESGVWTAEAAAVMGAAYARGDAA